MAAPTAETVFAEAEKLPVEERLKLVNLLTASMLGASAAVAAIPKAAVGKASAKAADGPKREANWWLKGTMHVRGLLADAIKADKAAGIKVSGTAPVVVSSMLKEAGQLSAEVQPSAEEALAMYEEYKANPPAPKSASGSVASKGSATGSAKTKYSELTDEEKKAKRSEAAVRAAATRKANKEAKAAAGGAAAVAPKNTGETTEDGREIWVIGGKRYAKVETALWDAETLKWAGELQEDGGIDTTAAEPELEMEDE